MCTRQDVGPFRILPQQEGGLGQPDEVLGPDCGFTIRSGQVGVSSGPGLLLKRLHACIQDFLTGEDLGPNAGLHWRADRHVYDFSLAPEAGIGWMGAAGWPRPLASPRVSWFPMLTLLIGAPEISA